MNLSHAPLPNRNTVGRGAFFYPDRSAQPRSAYPYPCQKARQPMTIRRLTQHRPAFSLIELIVTISIISVLIGILLPTLPRAFDAARRTACGANMRSIGQALELYKGDSNEVFPVARYMSFPWLSGLDGVDGDANPVSLDDEQIGLASFPDALALGNFLDADSEAWRCPGDAIVWTTEYEFGGETRLCNASYTYVTGLSGQRFEQSFFSQFLQRGPSDTAVSFDFDGGTFEKEAAFGGGTVFVDFFHSNRNVLFVDGSVRSSFD